MSKSKGNVVVPDEYIEKFGADTLRTYLMFLGPYNGGGDFRDTGIEGMARFMRRIWELYHAEYAEKTDELVIIKRHQTIKRVSQDISEFKYNTAIAAIMEYVNTLKDHGAGSVDLEVLAQLLAPFAPHMTEEVWSQVLQKEGSIHTSSWPEYNETYLVEDTITIPVQINGKVRATIAVTSVQKDNKEEILTIAKADEKVSKWIEGEQVVDEVYIPGRVVNFVTK